MGFFDSIGDFGGSIANALGSVWATGKQIDSAKFDIAFQKDMATHAYQYAMEDMKAAGLNPMLASKLGGSATPGGATAGRIENPATSAVNAYMQRQLQKEQIDNIRFDNNLKYSQTGQSDTVARVNKAEAAIREAQIPATNAETGARIAEAVARVNAARTEGEIDASTYGKVMRYIDRAPISNATDIKRSFAPAETRHRSRSTSESIFYKGD